MCRLFDCDFGRSTNHIDEARRGRFETRPYVNNTNVDHRLTLYI